MDLVDELLEFRKSTGLSQEDVARSLDVALNTYRNWELRNFFPSKMAQTRIKKFLKEKGVKQ